MVFYHYYFILFRARTGQALSDPALGHGQHPVHVSGLAGGCAMHITMRVVNDISRIEKASAWRFDERLEPRTNPVRDFRQHQRRMTGTAPPVLFMSRHTHVMLRFSRHPTWSVKHGPCLLLRSCLEAPQADYLALWTPFCTALAANPAPMSTASASVPCASVFCPELNVISPLFPGWCVFHVK